MYIAFLNFEAAFDSVPHGPLIKKFHHICFDSKFILCITNCLI